MRPIITKGELTFRSGGRSLHAPNRAVRRHCCASNPWPLAPSVRSNLVFGSDNRWDPSAGRRYWGRFGPVAWAQIEARSHARMDVCRDDGDSATEAPRKPGALPNCNRSELQAAALVGHDNRPAAKLLSYLRYQDQCCWLTVAMTPTRLER
jgi:hypothetical protein